MNTDIKDGSVTNSTVSEIIEGFKTEESQEKIEEGFRTIKEYVSNNSDPNEIAEIVERLYFSQENSTHVGLGFRIVLGIQSMTTENGIFTRDNELKGNVEDILLGLEERNLLSKVTEEVYEEWKNTWEYTQKEYKGGTKILEMILQSNFPATIILQKRIIKEGHDIFRRLPPDRGKISRGFNAERVIVGMLKSVDRMGTENFNDDERARLEALYKLCKNNQMVGKLDNLEKLLK